MRKALAASFPTHLQKYLLALLLALALAFAFSAQAFAAQYSAIVVDANTGKTLHSASADGKRYPASLTKMMTLYIIFEAMQSGKLKKTTKIPFSAQA
ncbi:MAG: D-alanyl-D-alanine carboxypeptidase, partial [Rhizobiaceae bacterium]